MQAAERPILITDDDQTSKELPLFEARGAEDKYKPKISKRMMKAYNLQSFAAQQAPPQTPTLTLESINQTFQTKRVDLFETLKIGRQVSPKQPPSSDNGVFDSKVLSRQHAEVWYEDGKVFIKDVASSNGTFVNGERLSAEGVPSEKHELKNGDTIEFGVDIMNDEGTEVMYKKVQCKVSISGAPVAASKETEQIPETPAKQAKEEAAPSQLPAQSQLADAAYSILEDEVKSAMEKSSQLDKISKHLEDVEKLIDLKSEPVIHKELEDAKQEVQMLKKQLQQANEVAEKFKKSAEESEVSFKAAISVEKTQTEKKLSELNKLLEEERSGHKNKEVELLEIKSLLEDIQRKSADNAQKTADLDKHVEELQSKLKHSEKLISDHEATVRSLSDEKSQLLTEKEAKLAEKEKQLSHLQAQFQQAQEQSDKKLKDALDQLKDIKEKLELFDVEKLHQHTTTEGLTTTSEQHTSTLQQVTKEQETMAETQTKDKSISTAVAGGHKGLKVSEAFLIAVVSFAVSYFLALYSNQSK